MYYRDEEPVYLAPALIGFIIIELVIIALVGIHMQLHAGDRKAKVSASFEKSGTLVCRIEPYATNWVEGSFGTSYSESHTLRHLDATSVMTQRFEYPRGLRCEQGEDIIGACEIHGGSFSSQASGFQDRAEVRQLCTR